MSARILVVDNYDSFVFNLVQYLYQLGAECEVLRNDEVALSHAQDGFDGVLLSPGPGTPEQAGVCVDMVRHCAATGVPVFGVCLGMQSMAVAYGGVVDRAPELLHGKTSPVTHEGRGVFAGLPSPFTATPLPLARGGAHPAARRAGGHGPDRGRHHHGAAPPRTARRRGAVPPGVGAHRARPSDARQLAGTVW
ncbi:truncated glutamine amidotransferase [Streptomyces clavuligerus]|nr:truncated glutamine amidotransferase [Streptomyces clavuligerus]